MSETITKIVTCPKCQQKTATDLICSANSESDPEIRDAVFSDRFFKWKCVKCGFETKMLHPLLYSDIKHGFMVYYIPRVERSRVADESLEKEFRDLAYIRKRVVPDVNTMKEKIVLLEHGINDMAMELAKHAVAEIVAKSAGQTVYSGYFTDMNREENTISFQFFVGPDRRSYFQTTKYEVYARSLSIVKKYFASEEKKGGFLNVNRSWAKSALLKYKSMD